MQSGRGTKPRARAGKTAMQTVGARSLVPAPRKPQYQARRRLREPFAGLVLPLRLRGLAC